MRRLSLFITLLYAAISSGCTACAEYGQGGAAEDLPYAETVDEDLAVIEITRELRQEFNLAQRHLDVLTLKGAQRCFPASVHTARLRENRVAREIAGGLLSDAETSLVDFHLDIHHIQQKLETLANSDSCWGEGLKPASFTTPPVTVNPSSSEVAEPLAKPEFDARYLLAQLNSDNQFAFDSDRVNPKYEENLARACTTLLQRLDISLVITGHADASGDRLHNSDLSSRRALSVAGYLVDCGISPERISLASQGDLDPQYSGRSPEIDLVNRRVSIAIHFDEQWNPQ